MPRDPDIWGIVRPEHDPKWGTAFREHDPATHLTGPVFSGDHPLTSGDATGTHFAGPLWAADVHVGPGDGVGTHYGSPVRVRLEDGTYEELGEYVIDPGDLIQAEQFIWPGGTSFFGVDVPPIPEAEGKRAIVTLRFLEGPDGPADPFPAPGIGIILYSLGFNTVNHGTIVDLSTGPFQYQLIRNFNGTPTAPPSDIVNYQGFVPMGPIRLSMSLGVNNQVSKDVVVDLHLEYVDP